MDDVAGTITALGTLVVALGTLVTALWAIRVSIGNSRKADVAARAAITAAAAAEAAKVATEEGNAILVATQEGVFALGPQLDGRLTQLLKTQLAGALAAGRIEGAATERATHANEAKAAVAGEVAIAKANGTAAALIEAAAEGTAAQEPKP